jgi:putative transposase
MIKNHAEDLKDIMVNAKDRKYQFWERNPLSVEICSEKVLLQKLKYMHENPVRAVYVNIQMIINTPQRYFINTEKIIGDFLHI